MTIRLALPLLASATLLGGCAHPENYRWSNVQPVTFEGQLTEPDGSAFGKWSKPAVSIYSFATPSPTPSDAGLKDLSDRGQAALIAAMTAADAKPADIRDALAKPIKAKAETTEYAVVNEGAYKRTLVANVTKGWDAVPGERLVWTWIHVKPVNFLFDGYSIIATDNQLLNIEQITNATTAGVTGSLGKTGTDTSVTNTAGSPVSSVLTDVAGSSAGVSGSLSNTRTTTAAINQQYVKLGADIVPTELRILRESERNLDVAGNTLIALTMRLDPTRWTALAPERTQRVTKLDLIKDDGQFANLAEAEFDVTQNMAPPRCPLLANVSLYYQLRKPVDGRSYVEGEHRAKYEKAQYNAGEVVILPADEVRKPSWRVYSAAYPGKALQVAGPLGYNNVIDFTSFEQARNFAAWLDHHASKIAGQMEPTIGKSGYRLSSGIDGARISSGPYFADATPDPNNLADICTRMRAQTPTPVATPSP